jgi:hypothetical protein
LSSCAMSSPSAVAATITKLQGSKQVEYDRAQAAAQAEAKREYSVADSGGGRGCPGGSDVGPYYAGGLVFTGSATLNRGQVAHSISNSQRGLRPRHLGNSAGGTAKANNSSIVQR